MRVVEIFSSIDGEGVRAGELATFVRLAGCNLHCSYCDTSYAQDADSGKEMTMDDVMSEVARHQNTNVTLTGGEPLLNGCDLACQLADKGYNVNIETNGSLDITPVLRDGIIVTMDFKTPSSGETESMLLSNLNKLRPEDVLKFVMADTDVDFVEKLLQQSYPLHCPFIYLSPVFGKGKPAFFVECLKRWSRSGIDTGKMRVQLQLHKYIWDPNTKGV